MKPKLVLLGSSLMIGVIFLLFPYYQFMTKTLKIEPLKALLSKDSLKTFDNQVNILILGIPGGNHDGPNLSDLIMVASYNLHTNRLNTISIPRDIWSDTLRDKINTAYAYGEAKKNGGGLKLAKAEISFITNLPIHYATVIDFSKFEQLIDFIGGIDVHIERSFVDKKFPIAGRENDDCGGDKKYSCRYEIVAFDKGVKQMDGKTALKFVRSRNAAGIEGSDFAREKRQQKVIDAVSLKLTQMIARPDLNKIHQVYQKINQLVVRDITNQQLAVIAKNIVFRKVFLRKNFIRKQFTLTEDFFFVPPYYRYDGKYVLIPQNDSFDAIHDYINRQLKKEGKEN